LFFEPDTVNEGDKQVNRLSVGAYITNYLKKQVTKNRIVTIDQGVWDSPIRTKVMFNKSPEGEYSFELIINDKSVYKSEENLYNN
jgi:hypothetical protein